MKPIIKTPYNAQELPRSYEHPVGPSMTIPDMSMTISEIMNRHSRGLSIDGVKVPIWDDNAEDDFLPDPRTLDLAEREELQIMAAEKLRELQQKDKKWQAKKSAKTKEALPAPPKGSEGPKKDGEPIESTNNP